MYKRIIKSNQAKYIENTRVEGAGKPGDTPPEGGDSAQYAAGPSPEEMQAAYDELLAAAQEEVSLLLDDARREARGILGKAQDESSRLRESAKSQGYDAGIAEGREVGRTQAADEMRGLLERGQGEVDRVLKEAYEAKDRMLEEMETKIYKLSLDIAEKILSYELDHNEEAFMAILSQAVGSIRAETKVTLRVNASEFMRYFHSRDQARIRTENGPVTAGVVIDASVEPGGCLIETDTGMIDASTRAQIEQIAFNLGVER